MKFKIDSLQEYQAQYAQAQQDVATFWREISSHFEWFNPGKQTLYYDFTKGAVNWFADAGLNITVNCLERHLADKADDIALIFEPNELDGQTTSLTYQQLHDRVLEFAGLLLDRGITKGDRVAIYLPMIPQAIIAMLACARIGAVHSVVFAGFSAPALAKRIQDCGAKLLITTDLSKRGAKNINLLEIANQAISSCISITEVIVYQRTSEPIELTKPYIIWQNEIGKYTANTAAAVMQGTDPLFILYTSGSTGTPKGIVHATAGYMVYSAYSFANVFGYTPGEKYFCTADVGWITGHSYLVYGPLLCGATIVMYEGIPTYPTPSRLWQIIEKHQVNIFYTAPTAIRALMSHGDKYIQDYQLSSLKTLGTVGEPINQEAWDWYNQKVGNGRCHLVDTWWQTETGGILISALAGITRSQPTCAGFPLPGIKPVIVDNQGQEVTLTDVKGNLCFKQPWPSMLLGIWGDTQRTIDTYYTQFPGYYFSGDGCYQTADGQYRITGRVDDVINVSGHRLGTAEIEDAINTHAGVVESAVIGIPHAIKGEAICAYVIVHPESSINHHEITQTVAKQIGKIAQPDKIIVTHDLPKTRSGKIMRRILRGIANKHTDLGDTSTLINPEIIKDLQAR
jgi:acetyl-CoA synthetase